MKAIILVSSIFYIIGLKIGNIIDVTPNQADTVKVISNKIAPCTDDKTAIFNTEKRNLPEIDSLQSAQPVKKMEENADS